MSLMIDGWMDDWDHDNFPSLAKEELTLHFHRSIENCQLQSRLHYEDAGRLTSTLHSGRGRSCYSSINEIKA
jgi:hypothetical protein